MKQQIESRIKELEAQHKELSQRRQMAQQALQQAETKLIGIAEAVRELRELIAEPKEKTNTKEVK